jgi:AraC family transcriptional regulator
VRAGKETEVEARIVTLPSKKLVGARIRMSYFNNHTFELWRSFMPRRKEIKNTARPELYSIEIYGPQFFSRFDPAREFEKWAAIEVTDFNIVAAGLETFTMPEGLYAVFNYKGPGSAASGFIQKIFINWLPHSDFCLDERPYFALMGAKYLNEDHNSEEELWIPVKPVNIQ